MTSIASTFLVEGIKGISCELILDLFSLTKRAKKSVHKNKKKERKLEKVVENSFDFTDELSDDLEAEIIRISNHSDMARKCYTGVAMNSRKFINFAMYFMTHDNAELMKACKNDREFVNGISELAGYGKIYPNSGTADITKYDAEKLEKGYGGSHIILIEELEAKFRDPYFNDRWRAKLARLSIWDPSIKQIGGPINNSGISGRVDENGHIHPFFFDASSTQYVQPDIKDDTISTESFNFLERNLRPLLPDDQYHYYRTDNQGNYILTIVKNDSYHAEEKFLIDDGRIMGGKKVSVLATYLKPDGSKDTIFVDIDKHPDIATHVFSSVFNTLTPEMAMAAARDGFNNGVIYHNIDFSNTEWMNSYDVMEMQSLERHLTAIIKTLDSDVRLRFEKYSYPDEFTLVSDNLTYSPLCADGTTAAGMVEGLRYVVHGDLFSKYYGEQLYGNYKIESVKQ